MSNQSAATATKLSVNLNAVAFLRNRRDMPWPSVIEMARLVLDAGAHGITVHPRPDQRHIRFSDVHDLSALIAADYPGAEFNVEGYPTPEFLDLAMASKAHQVTLVPDAPGQSTSDHGWNVAQNLDLLQGSIDALRRNGQRVSLFVDVDASSVLAAAEVGADRVEFYTGPYAALFEGGQHRAELERFSDAAQAARHACHNARPDTPGLTMNAGHDLTLANFPALKAVLPDLAEVSIGHGITADALIMGFPEAVRRYLQVLS
ncbi:Pyridoxine 5'-phosphate synthase [Falsiruegeria litorea R37]|uniref:Pyridoxine 5'-phosphate synthase n=1 Tax=Falsiruegeria litorea R37 TaxID=1200284 RepID=A0A1Y5RL68_9RHOB|nr:pyridoxine 5'-phosphate synthase [Falsiruegeria litorea]SLN19737.1 Pyridoxine 5'-phosphate synthase [Falsiruegeria litorea R37]